MVSKNIFWMCLTSGWRDI